MRTASLTLKTGPFITSEFRDGISVGQALMWMVPLMLANICIAVLIVCFLASLAGLALGLGQIVAAALLLMLVF